MRPARLWNMQVDRPDATLMATPDLAVGAASERTWVVGMQLGNVSHPMSRLGEVVAAGMSRAFRAHAPTTFVNVNLD